MKKQIQVLTILVAIVAMIVPAAFAAPKADVTRIKDGVLVYSAGHYLAGEPIPLGFDAYGYNYQGHMFLGSYANAYLGGAGYPPYEGDDETYLAENPTAESHWTWPYRNDKLMMKWNDAWLANTDADGDGLLDRAYDNGGVYIGSGAWLTNHMTGINEDGTHWTYFTKIVAAPADAYTDSGYWFTSDGIEIGEVIWGSFATIMTVETDPMLGTHGLQYVSPYSAGFGVYVP